MLLHSAILPWLKCQRINHNVGVLQYFAGEPPRATEEQKAKVKIVNTAAVETTMDAPYLMYHTFDGTHDPPYFCGF